MTDTWKNGKSYWNVNGSNNAYCREAERLERERKKLEDMEKYKENYIRKKAVFFNLALTDGLLVIKVLQSVDEFLEEGKAMHHCVYTNEYYNQDNTLILSARIDGKRIETVELSLDTFKVVTKQRCMQFQYRIPRPHHKPCGEQCRTDTATDEQGGINV